MELIKDKEFGGERPLFESHNLHLDNVVIREGESAIKECSNIKATNCRFEGNYPFWHVHGFVIDRCHFDVGGRSALWYSDHLRMTDTHIDAPKMFREMHDIDIENVVMTDATRRSGDARAYVLRTCGCKEERILLCSAATLKSTAWCLTPNTCSNM